MDRHAPSPFERSGDRLGRDALGAVARLPVYALLDRIRGVGNVGSIFRTADAAGLAGLYLTGYTATPPRPDMEKTALGATETVPWSHWIDPLAAVEHLRERDVRIVALEQTGDALSLDALDDVWPTCFILGNEVDGVAPALLARVDASVEIPMSGLKKSLNVAVSFGVLAFELRRRWAAAGREGA
jgi:tRNA G18 (ribose-2'-O)-methylase SpoU